MWVALDAHQLLLAADTPENHRQFDRMSLRTFILPAHSTPQEATDVITTMRNMFDLRFVSPGQTAGTVEVRGPQPIIEACTKLMDQLKRERPQVMLGVRVYQIDHQLARNIGVHIPYTFNMFNIPAAALAGLGGQNIQDLINQLIASGGINQAGSSALSGLLAQLGGQQNSIFSQPLATFGGGLTFMGLSLDHRPAQAEFQKGDPLQNSRVVSSLLAGLIQFFPQPGQCLGEILPYFNFRCRYGRGWRQRLGGVPNGTGSAQCHEQRATRRQRATAERLRLRGRQACLPERDYHQRDRSQCQSTGSGTERP